MLFRFSFKYKLNDLPNCTVVQAAIKANQTK